jgi:hypothetical protein
MLISWRVAVSFTLDLLMNKARLINNNNTFQRSKINSPTYLGAFPLIFSGLHSYMCALCRGFKHCWALVDKICLNRCVQIRRVPEVQAKNLKNTTLFQPHQLHLPSPSPQLFSSLFFYINSSNIPFPCDITYQSNLASR